MFSCGHFYRCDISMMSQFLLLLQPTWQNLPSPCCHPRADAEAAASVRALMDLLLWADFTNIENNSTE